MILMKLALGIILAWSAFSGIYFAFVIAVAARYTAEDFTNSLFPEEGGQ